MYLSCHLGEELKDIKECVDPGTLQRFIDDGKRIIEQMKEIMEASEKRLAEIETFDWKSEVVIYKFKMPAGRYGKGYTTNEVYVRQWMVIDGLIKNQRRLKSKQFDEDWRAAKKYAAELAEEFKCKIDTVVSN